jgi:hypothetical protein
MSESVREQLIDISLQAAPDNPYARHRFTFRCHGRDAEGNETLDEPVPVVLEFYQNPLKSSFTSQVQCQFVTGGHAQRCRASHQDYEDCNKHGQKVYCPYVTSLGWVEGKYKDPPPVRRDY